MSADLVDLAELHRQHPQAAGMAALLDANDAALARLNGVPVLAAADEQAAALLVLADQVQAFRAELADVAAGVAELRAFAREVTELRASAKGANPLQLIKLLTGGKP